MAASPPGSVVSAGMDESPTGKRGLRWSGGDTGGQEFFSGMAGPLLWSFPEVPGGSLHGSALGYLETQHGQSRDTWGPS